MAELRQFILFRGVLLFLLVLGFTMGFAQTNSKVERLENLLKLSKTDTSKVKYLNLLYQEYISSAPLKAKQYAEQALEIAEKVQYPRGVMQSADQIAFVYHQQGGYDQALKYYEQALNIKRSISTETEVAESLTQIGNVRVLQGDIQAALDSYEASLDIHKKTQNALGVCKNYTNLGGAFYQQQKYKSSIDYHIKALQIADSLGNKEFLGYNLNRLGKTYFRIQDFGEAIKCYQQLLFIGKNQSNREFKQSAYSGMSQIYAEQKDFKKAYEFYQLYNREQETLFRKLQDEAKEDIEDAQIRLNENQKYRDLQEEKLKLQNDKLLQRTWIFGIVVLFILAITFILYRNNLSSQKVNQQLRDQQKLIEIKNEELEGVRKKMENQNQSIQRKNVTLEATFKEIERKNRDITASINYAKRIQESMLSRDGNIASKLPEYFVLYKPRDIVSGDFYWFMEKDDKVIIAAVDCTGHGVPGAIMSMLGDSYLNQIINTQGIIKPDEILTELHKNIQLALNQEQTNNQDGMDVALCVIDSKKKVLEFSGASRELFIIQDGVFEVIQSNRLPIGGFQKERPREFTTQTFNLDTETYFYIYSDGFQDQFGGPRGRKFAKSRLYKALYANYQSNMAEQKELLNKTLESWMGQNRQMDDIMVIGVKVS